MNLLTNVSEIRRYLVFARATGPPEAAHWAEAEISLLGHGSNNRLYELTTPEGAYVLKMYPAGREIRMRREYEALCELEPWGVAPQAMAGDPAGRHVDAPVLIYRKISGTPLSVEKLETEDVSKLPAVWQRIHLLDVPTCSMLSEQVGPASPYDCLAHIDGLLRALRSGRTSSDPRMVEGINQFAMLRRRLDGLPSLSMASQHRRMTLCHVDSRIGNMIRDEQGHLRLVDWEHAGFMEPACDLAGFFCHPETVRLPAALRENCLRVYAGLSEDPYVYEKAMLYLSVLAVQWMGRLLALIHDYDAQKTQPWAVRRSVEELWMDVEVYRRIGAAL